MNIKNRSALFIGLLLAAALLAACNAPITETPQPQRTDVPPTEAMPPAPTPTQPFEAPPVDTLTEIIYGVLTLSLPSTVADGAGAMELPPETRDAAAWWQKTPGHLQVTLADYYVLHGKFQQPTIYVYPAQAYAELVPPAFESLHRLNNILAGTDAEIAPDQLPALPFLNARQVFASNMERLSFRNGDGIRFLTQYASAPSPANNNELFYQFQGVTHDGAYYIIAIFPVTVPGLADDFDSGKAFPVGGMTFPDMGDPAADWQGYYAAVTELLRGESPEAFTPGLDSLDALIQSMDIVP